MDNRTNPQPAASYQQPSPPARVVVVDFDMSIGNLMMLFLKMTIAVFPAAILWALLWAGCALMLRLLSA